MNPPGKTSDSQSESGSVVCSIAWVANDAQTKDFMRWFGMATGLWADFDATPPSGKEMWRRKATEYHQAKLVNAALCDPARGDAGKPETL